MKHVFQIFFCLSFLIGGQSLAGQKVYEGMIYVRQNIAEVKNDSVYLSMDINIHGLKVNSRESLMLYPVLFHGSDSLQLPPVVLNGKKKQQKADRTIVLKGSYAPQKKAYAVLKNNPVIHQVVVYDTTLLYSPWMKEAGLKLIGETKNQNEKTVHLLFDTLTDDLKLRN
jgi:hypothetical protein